jgi:hypothetical protein
MPHRVREDDGSHRHLAMPHRRTCGEAFGRVDDGVGVHAVMAIASVASVARMSAATCGIVVPERMRADRAPRTRAANTLS